MSRKDTIIIAILINAGLLALLFMLAVNTDDDVADQPEITKALVERAPAEQKNAPTQLTLHTPDETDNFLMNLASDEDFGQPIVIDEDGFIEFDKSPQVVIKSQAPVEKIGDDKVPYVEVTVKRGDALEKIARSNGTTVEAIKKANNMSSTKLSIGQVLKVPVSKKEEPTANTFVPKAPVAPPKPPYQPPSPSAPKLAETKAPAAPLLAPKLSETKVQAVPPADQVATADQYYTIKSGDNPWKIARQYNVGFEDLLKLNNLDEEKARNLKIGDKIRVR